MAWVVLFGPTASERTNAALGLLGFFSLAVAAFNLLPVRPLDGATAWRIVPLLLDRRSTRSSLRSLADPGPRSPDRSKTH